MKMKNYRLFLLGFVTAAFVFLTGFTKLDNNKVLTTEKQKVSIIVKHGQSKGKESHVRLKHNQTKKQHSVLSIKNDATEDSELQKELDLSMPFEDSENAGLKIEQNRAAQGEFSNMFATDKKDKPRPISLDSQMLMSQEPEMDKRKSLDGAEIVINLKR